MNKYLNYISGLLVFSFIAISCSLDRDPLEKFAEGTFYSSASNTDLALTSLYRGNITNGLEFAPSDWWSYQGMIMMEHLSDNAFDRRGMNNPLSRISNGTLDANNGVINNYWKASYTRIGYCNRFLTGMETQPDNAANRTMIAEARFLRAAMYFYMASFFKDVPLVEKNLTGEEANNVDKTPQSEILSWCVKELRAAADNLPSFAKISAADNGRANKQAALAFLGRTYMLMKDWSNAAKTYKEIIDLGENQLHARYSELFYPSTGANTKENIFFIQYKKDIFGCGLPQHGLSAKDGGWSLINPAAELFEAYEFTNGTPFSYDNPLHNYKEPGKNRDPRLDYTIYYPGATFKGTTYVLSPDLTGKKNLGYSEEASRTGFMMRKYFEETQPIDNLQSYAAVTPIVRYAEVLLSYAECVNELDQMTQAIMNETVNKVRGRSSVNMPAKTAQSQGANREIIRNERRVELAMEGIRYWDLMRWGIAHENLAKEIWGVQCVDAKTYEQKSRKVDPTGKKRWFVAERKFRNPQDYKWPVPQSEQNINPKLRDK